MTELILRDILVQICWSYCTPTSELLYKGWTSIVFISNHSSGNLNTLWVAASKLSCQRNFAQFYNYHQLITSEGPLMGVFSVLKLPTCAITLKMYIWRHDEPAKNLLNFHDNTTSKSWPPCKPDAPGKTAQSAGFLCRWNTSPAVRTYVSDTRVPMWYNISSSLSAEHPGQLGVPRDYAFTQFKICNIRFKYRVPQW